METTGNVPYCYDNLTWFPKTPMLQADETWLLPNQTAANLAGSDNMNTCETATIDWPMKAT